MGSSLSFWGEDLFCALWLSVHEPMTAVRAITMTVSRSDITQLQQIPNVGPSIAANLRLIGITVPQDLVGRDPYRLYDELCRTTGTRHDPCVIDVFTLWLTCWDHRHWCRGVSRFYRTSGDLVLRELQGP
jgi:hypothetical protein